MLYTIYKITNKINGKIYIGKHQTNNPNDSYFGSGKAIAEAIRKHGKNNFTKEVLFIFDSENEMNLKERELVTEEFVTRNDTYNLGVGGEGGAHFRNKRHTEITKDKVRNTIKSMNIISSGFAGKTHQLETVDRIREKISGSGNGNYGKFWITDGVKSMMIENTSDIPEGWRRGRIVKRCSGEMVHAVVS
jgi:group I intron endonuclease